MLHLVTDRRRLSDVRGKEGGCVLELVRQAGIAGIDIVQIRERDLDGGALFDLVVEAVRMTRGTSTRVLVNDRLDIALAAGADGVHLRADSLAPSAARSMAPAGFVVGRSVHSLQEATAVEASVDYLIAGTVWPSDSKQEPGPLLGLEGLREIAGGVRVPVVAIGGCTLRTAGAAAAAGAAGLAGIGLFMSPIAVPSGCRATPLVELAASVRRAFGIT